MQYFGSGGIAGILQRSYEGILQRSYEDLILVHVTHMQYTCNIYSTLVVEEMFSQITNVSELIFYISNLLFDL